MSKLNDYWELLFKEQALARYPDLYKIGAMLTEIEYIKVEKNNCLVYTVNNEEIVFRASLKSILARFGEKHFLRIHRSYCVNRRYLDGILKVGRNWRAICGEMELPISRHFFNSVRESCLKK